jgi:hypothetical protein
MDNQDYVIVGVDPGFITAFAVLNFKREVIKIDSRKEFGLNRFISEISSYGKIAIVACDTITIPNFVLKLAKKFHAVIIKPLEELSRKKKRQIIKDFDKNLVKKINNRHEIDALAAAIIAYKRFSPLINKIKNLNITEERKSKLIILLIRQEFRNIKEALKELNENFSH